MIAVAVGFLVLLVLAVVVFDRVFPILIASRERIQRMRSDTAIRIAELGRPEQVKRQQIESVTLPDDLEAYCNDWQDQFAKDDTRAMLRAKYLELHTGNPDETWQAVRRSIGIGELP